MFKNARFIEIKGIKKIKIGIFRFPKLSVIKFQTLSINHLKHIFSCLPKPCKTCKVSVKTAAMARPGFGGLSLKRKNQFNDEDNRAHSAELSPCENVPN